ncbi:HK97 gp10 family phage protein [uncultured Sneathia sp.]|uniref:HK97 gp10 family phage protein n=1 Tax=uncultured Sneathia sp. TaxID=278067 RepID=UPI0025933951|nr:HK97 gp10 family phage protein [uncultured Sneathia sp.]
MELKIDTSELKKLAEDLRERAPKELQKAFADTISKEMSILGNDTFKLTPVNTGYLRNGWFYKGQYSNVAVGNVSYKDVIKIGNIYSLSFENDVPYAEYVEIGHRLVNSNWWEGFHMLEKSEIAMQSRANNTLKFNIEESLKKFRW